MESGKSALLLAVVCLIGVLAISPLRVESQTIEKAPFGNVYELPGSSESSPAAEEVEKIPRNPFGGVAQRIDEKPAEAGRGEESHLFSRKLSSILSGKAESPAPKGPLRSPSRIGENVFGKVPVSGEASPFGNVPQTGGASPFGNVPGESSAGR